MVKTKLLRQIQINNFPRGSALPPERLLAEQYGVSYMTMRKGIDALVAENYLEKRPGVGNFVRRDVPRNKLSGMLGIIGPTWDSPEMMDFVIHASAVAEINGWCPKLFFSRSWEDRQIEDAWNTCDALWIVPPGSMDMIPEAQHKRFSSFEKPVVFIGVGGNVLGLDTVRGAPGQGIRKALELFKAAGHRRVTYLAQYATEHKKDIHPAQADYAYWQEWLKEQSVSCEENQLFYDITVPPYELPHKLIYEQLMQRGRENINFTGIVVSLSLAWGCIAALHDLGLRVPDDVSIVAIGDRQEAAFYRPRITTVGKSLRVHAEEAMAVTNFRLENRNAPVQCQHIEPEIVNGETLKIINQ